MSSDNLITNFAYLARRFDVHAFNTHGERMLTDDEIIELILPYYLEANPVDQYVICMGLAGIRKANELYAKIQELKSRKGLTNAKHTT